MANDDVKPSHEGQYYNNQKASNNKRGGGSKNNIQNRANVLGGFDIISDMTDVALKSIKDNVK